ncbi:MAG: DNA polymerase IV [Thermoanaerobaculia bacterium]
MIGCLDLDSFYVSCEIAKNPSLSGKPVVVSGGDGVRGVVLSSSYEARKYGIRSGMPLFRARDLYPYFLIVEPDFKFYEEVSRGIKELIFSYAPVVEQASIDEFYFSLEGCERLYRYDFFNVIFEIRKKIKENFKIPSSAGLSSNKCTSKILSKVAKPDGQIYVPEGKERNFLADLPLKFIPGLGKKTGEKLQNMGFERIGDLQICPKEILMTILGKEGEEIQRKALGTFEEPFFLNYVPKSIGKERTFFEEKINLNEILNELFWIVEEVVFRMRALSLSARKMEIKLRYGDFETKTSSYTFKEPVDGYKIIQRKAKEIFLSLYKRRVRVRLIGFTLSGFEKCSGQEILDIFKEKRENQILKTVDFLKEKFGSKCIYFGGSKV